MWRLLHFLQRKFPLLYAMERKIKRFTLPGFAKVPVFEVVIFFMAELKDNTMVTRAQAIAFSFFLAVFPAILFSFTLIPYLPINNLEANTMLLLKQVLPNQQSFEFMRANIIDVIHKPRFGLLSFGFISALYLSTNGVITMMRSFDKTYDIYTRRNFFHQRWIALKLTLLLFILLLSSVLVIIGGDVILEWIFNTFHFLSAFSQILLQTLRFTIIAALFLFAISMIYYYGPAVKEKWRFISAGSITATILSIFISIAFSYYVKHFANYNKVYGSLGTIIILQVWFYLNSLVLLIGFELNASIYYNKSLKEKLKGD